MNSFPNITECGTLLLQWCKWPDRRTGISTQSWRMHTFHWCIETKLESCLAI